MTNLSSGIMGTLTASDKSAQSPKPNIFKLLWDGVAVVAAIVIGGLLMVVSSPVLLARTLHKRIGQMRKTLISMWLVFGGAFAFLYLNLIELSEFAAKPLTALIGCSIFYVVVRFGHNEINVIQELQQGNHAPAIYFLAYAGIIALALLAG